MQKRVYLAAPFFNDEEIERVEKVAKVLRDAHGLDVFSPKENQLEGTEYMSQPWRDAIFANDCTNIHKADIMVAIYDGNDAGTYFEIGYAYANRIPIIVYNEKDDLANLMVTESARAWIGTHSELVAYDFEAMPRNKYNGKMV